MKIFYWIFVTLILLVIGRMIYLSMTAKAPESKLLNGQLRVCPGTPNCVSSDSNNDSKKVESFTYHNSTAQAWKSLQDAVLNAGGKVIYQDGKHLHATFTSNLFRFVDDMEFLLNEDKKIIAVRSASRVGKSDLGVNRKNVAKVREIFEKLNKNINKTIANK